MSDTGWEVDGWAVRRIRRDPAVYVDTSRWPATVPAVEQVRHLLSDEASS